MARQLLKWRFVAMLEFAEAEPPSMQRSQASSSSFAEEQEAGRYSVDLWKLQGLFSRFVCYCDCCCCCRCCCYCCWFVVVVVIVVGSLLSLLLLVHCLL